MDAAALRELVATVAADARLVRVPVNQPPWTPTGLAVTAGDDVSWLAWGSPYLVWPLAVAVRPRLTLRGRVDSGVPQDSARDTVTFGADRTGELRLGSLYPGELQADGTITTDRIRYRAMSGTLSAGRSGHRITIVTHACPQLGRQGHGAAGQRVQQSLT